jgi:hypothetical protein
MAGLLRIAFSYGLTKDYLQIVIMKIIPIFIIIATTLMVRTTPGFPGFAAMAALSPAFGWIFLSTLPLACLYPPRVL